MKIIDKLKALFVKKSTNISLSNLSDCVVIPKREELDANDMNDLDRYQQEYLKILHSKNIRFSGDITFEDIQNKILMYSHLLFRITNTEEDEEFDFRIATYEKEHSSEIDSQYQNQFELSFSLEVKRCKTSIYINYLQDLEKELLLRLVALREILENEILFPRKKSAVKEEINHLVCNYIAVKNQLIAAFIERENFYKDSLSSNHHTEGILAENNHYIEEYHQKLFTMLLEIYPSKASLLTDVTIANISIIECILEEYIYSHPDMVNELRNDLHLLIEEFEKTRDSSSAMLNKIKYLELKFELIARFGKKLVTKDDLFLLYDLKLRVKVEGVNFEKPFHILNGVNFTEMECYRKITMDKIESLVKGNEPSLNDLNITIRSAVPLIRKVLKHGKSHFDFWTILNHKKLLLFLFAFDRPGHIYETLQMKDDRFKYYNGSSVILEKHDSYFKHDIPLMSIYTIMDHEGDPQIQDDPLYVLYQLYQKNRCPDDEIHLLEGFHYEYDDKMIPGSWNVKSAFLGKKIFLPKTATKIATSLFNGISAEEIILNEGLEEIEGCFKDIHIKRLVISTPLKRIYCSFYHADVEIVRIKNYGKIPSNDNYFTELICQLLPPHSELLKTEKSEWDRMVYWKQIEFETDDNVITIDVLDVMKSLSDFQIALYNYSFWIYAEILQRYRQQLSIDDDKVLKKI